MDNIIIFTVTFSGREAGALGVRRNIRTTVQLPGDKYYTSEEIKLKLYEKYEHISRFKVVVGHHFMAPNKPSWKE